MVFQSFHTTQNIKSEKGQTSTTVIRHDSGINYIFSDAEPKKSLGFSIELSNDIEMNKDKNIERGQVYKFFLKILKMKKFGKNCIFKFGNALKVLSNIDCPPRFNY